MPDALPPLHDSERPHAWAVAYLDGSLSEAERASFEAHLEEHADCQKQVATLKAAFPRYARVLMEDGPPRPIEEVMEIVRATEERLRAQAEEQARRAKLDVGVEKTVDAIGRAKPVQPPPPARKPRWTWYGLGFGALTAAAAALLLFIQLFPAVEPVLIEVAASAPVAGTGPAPALPPPAVMLDLAPSLSLGRLELSVPREPNDSYTAVALVDAKGRQWLVQSGDAPDPTCCEPLKLRVKLDALAPGPFRVAVVLSATPFTKGDLHGWLPDAEREAPFGPRAYGVAKVER